MASEQFDRVAVALGTLNTNVVANATVAARIGQITPSAGTLASVTVLSTTTGQNIIVAGVANQAVRIYGMELFCNASNGISALSGTTGATVLWPLHNFLANQGVMMELRADPWFVGTSLSAAASNAFILNLSGAGTVAGIVYYSQAA